MSRHFRKVELYVTGRVTREADATITLEVGKDISNEDLLDIHDQLESMSWEIDWEVEQEAVVPEMIEIAEEVDSNSAAEFRIRKSKGGELELTKIEAEVPVANGKGRRGSGAGIVLKVVR